ncbi:PHD zinc finger-containing protein [Tieghemostelium lacteum]|uniref:PHD zinc finger-containing protein n=1 Tax=Tieghemostelium lacteum TaxID=361077 RepID=A0A152A7K4_TIELA|nr:PHD zinc finger-containing protein [Tieghemostelium lacteum]|eukprot:KYR02111.1 PHD zinc finger-containing protein [Tieghemostelium lacteum]
MSTPTTPSMSSANGDKTEGPGLMNYQKEKYGAHLFQRNSEGLYTCFFKDCGKMLHANFSRHISRHEADHDQLADNVNVKKTMSPYPTSPPISGQVSNVPSQPSALNLQQQQQLQKNNSNINITPVKMNPPVPTQHSMTPQMMHSGYIGQHTPYTTSWPSPSPYGMPMNMISPQNPLFNPSTMMDPMGLGAVPQPPVQSMQSPQPPTITTRASIKSNPSVAAQQQQQLDASLMDKKGSAYQVCQHPLHTKWWGTSSVLPSSEFYTRASKCKKCYIKQQQDSKKLRTQSSAGLSSIGAVASSVVEMGDLMMPPKIPLTRGNTLAMIPQHPGLMTHNKMMFNPMMQPQFMQSVQMHPSIQMQQQQLIMAQKQHLQQLHNQHQQYKYIPNQQHPQMMHHQNPPHHMAPHMTVSHGVQVGTPPPIPYAPKYSHPIIFRPKVEANPEEINRLMMEKCKAILSTLMKDHKSKYFREPVDHVKLQLTNYLDVIKEPMDFGTIDKRINYQPPQPTGDHQQPPQPLVTPYQNFMQFDQQVRLVFKNAMTYNENDTEVYEHAEELEKEYQELFDTALDQSRADASLHAEMVTAICAICKEPPKPYIVKKPAPNAVSVNAMAVDGNTPTTTDTTTDTNAVQTPQYDETIVHPLVVCDGSCLRAFHLQCIRLTPDHKGPWLCRDCSGGRPVLHYDSFQGEFFYYYYEGVPIDDQLISQELSAVDNNNHLLDPVDETTGDNATSPTTTTTTTITTNGANALSTSQNSTPSLTIVSDLGALSKEEKIKIRNEEEKHRAKEMYYDPIWCMWRCKSKLALKQREERQKPYLSTSQSKGKRVVKKKKSKKRHN